MRTFLHRRLWQALPRKWRRSLLFRTTSLAVPRPPPKARPTGPLIVAGTLRTASGLGEASRLCHEALQHADLLVHGIDLTEWLMQSVDFPDYSFVDGQSLDGPGTVLLHVNAPLVPLALFKLGQRFLKDKYIVGVWTWELPHIPSDWRFGVPFVHEIWVPTTFVAEAVRPIANGRPVRVIPYPVAVKKPSTEVVARHDTCIFSALLIFDMASSFARKNPVASIDAFRKAFGDDPLARLIVKISNSEAFPSGLSLIRKAIGSARNIIVIDRRMSFAEMDALYRESNLLISLHRSEGFGLTIAEAMLRGLPTVVTNWSGNIDFVNTRNGFPVPYRLVSAQDIQGTYHHPDMKWADADIEAASEALRRLRCDSVLSRDIGAAAAAYAAETWNAKAYATIVYRYLGL